MKGPAINISNKIVQVPSRLPSFHFKLHRSVTGPLEPKKFSWNMPETIIERFKFQISFENKRTKKHIES